MVIREAYEHFGKEVPSVKGHSTRAMATSMAQLQGASVPDICAAATWSSDHVFVKHYQLDLSRSKQGGITKEVLSAALTN